MSVTDGWIGAKSFGFGTLLTRCVLRVYVGFGRKMVIHYMY